MSTTSNIRLLLLFWFTCCSQLVSAEKTARSDELAALAVTTHFADAKEALAAMVRFPTVANGKSANDQLVAFKDFKRWLNAKCQELNLSYHDYGQTLVVAIGQGPSKLGLITHADVQPANPAMWQQNPFQLDEQTEPGRWYARGSEDDKGPIAAALYALKTLQDNLKQVERVELIIYLAEESDWSALKVYAKEYPQAPINLALDSEFPVVTAEKGWGNLTLGFHASPVTSTADTTRPDIQLIRGGAFSSQIPEQALAVAQSLSPQQKQLIQSRLRQMESHNTVSFTFTDSDELSYITVVGRSAHSSKPHEGINALSHLVHALAIIDWQPSPESALVNFIHNQFALGFNAEAFGTVAFNHPFMGSLTFSPTLLNYQNEQLTLTMNLRIPLGKELATLEQEIRAELSHWQTQTEYPLEIQDLTLSEPYHLPQAPQVQTLLDLYARQMQQSDAAPVAIGGATNARLFPNTVGFGPSFPGEVYSGHSEHEFITAANFRRMLKLYTSAIYELSQHE